MVSRWIDQYLNEAIRGSRQIYGGLEPGRRHKQMLLLGRVRYNLVVRIGNGR